LTTCCAAEADSCLPQAQRLTMVWVGPQDLRPVQQHRPFLPQAARSVSRNVPDPESTSHNTVERAMICRSQGPCTTSLVERTRVQRPNERRELLRAPGNEPQLDPQPVFLHRDPLHVAAHR
jgi:hypothetical protein